MAEVLAEAVLEVVLVEVALEVVLAEAGDQEEAFKQEEQ